MTEKQEQILDAALELFSNHGFHATSTSKVAKHAGVSEGLIFRHFKNKHGLLEAISKQAEERMQHIFGPIIFETNPKKQIALFLEMPFNVKVEEFEFWKLQFKLKWELDKEEKINKIQPLELTLESAFKELNYKQPLLEAKFLIHFIEGISTSIIRDNLYLDQKEDMINFLKEKYQL